MRTTRPTRPAISTSWVTTTTVLPPSADSDSRSSMISAPVVGHASEENAAL
jgi:hypothetical protein